MLKDGRESQVDIKHTETEKVKVFMHLFSFPDFVILQH